VISRCPCTRTRVSLRASPRSRRRVVGKGEAAWNKHSQNQEKWEQNGDVDGHSRAVLSAAEMTKVRALVKGGTLDAAIDKDYARWPDLPRQTKLLLPIFHCKVRRIPSPVS